MLRCASVVTAMTWLVSKNNLNFGCLRWCLKYFVRYLVDILHYHRFETGSGTYDLPRTADVSDLLWCPVSSLQLWHWTPVRQWLPQEHISCQVPDIKHSWDAHQEEDNPYPLLVSANLFNGFFQAILRGKHFFLQKHGCSVIDIL